jgi:hypothetical protein
MRWIPVGAAESVIGIYLLEVQDDRGATGMGEESLL